MRSIAHHDHRQKPERMKFLSIIFGCPEGARKWRILYFAMLLHSKNCPATAGQFFYSILPPPRTVSPSYKTAACPGVTARCGASNSIFTRPSGKTVASAGCSGWR